MNPLLAFGRRYSRVMVCGAWFWALSDLLAARQYESFLRPEFGVLLAAGGVVVLAFGFVEMNWLGTNPRFGLAEALRGAVLVAPLLYLPITRGVTLDADCFSKRWTGLNGYDPGQGAPLIEQAEQAVADDARSVTLVDLCWDSERYNGRRIAVEGMIKRVPEVAEEFGPDACLLYRFVISCCAADAMPAAILIVGELPPDSSDDTWIKAEGVFELESRGGRDLVRLNLERATRQPQPRNPYLY